MANLTLENEKWLVSGTDITESGFHKELNTNGKYLDRNIVVDVAVKGGDVQFDKATGEVQISKGYVTKDSFTLDDATSSAEVSIPLAGKDYISSTATSYPVVAKASGTVSQGYVTEETTVNATDATVYIKEGTVTTAPTTTRDAYEKANVGAVVRDTETEDAYLYIDAGYVENVKISLADLVPDKANIGVEKTSADIRVGTNVYDNDGQLVAGTMEDATFAVSAEVDADQVVSATDSQVVVDGTGYKVEVSTPITGTITTEVTKVGYVEEVADSVAVSGSADTTVKLAKAAITAKVAEGSTEVKVKPALSNSAISVVGVTDAAATGATTTQPTTGVYVKVDAAGAAATAGSVKVAADVTSAGYVKAGQIGDGIDFTTTAQDADALYVPIKAGSVAVTVPAISVNEGIEITGDQTQGYTVNVTGSGETAPQVTEGWVKEVAVAAVTVSGTASLVASKMSQDGVVGTNYVVSTSAGYNADKLEETIPVYQGEVIGA